jgi:ApaG protein
VFAYTITIANNGTVATQLISQALDHRQWRRHDAGGARVRRVVGEQPLLKPGDSFEYTSGTVISTAVGSMKGSYQMAAEDGVSF